MPMKQSHRQPRCIHTRDSSFQLEGEDRDNYVAVKFLFWVLISMVSKIIIQGASSMNHVVIPIICVRRFSMKPVSCSIPINCFFYTWLLIYRNQDVWDTMSMVYEFLEQIPRVISSRIISCTFSDLLISLVSAVLLNLLGNETCEMTDMIYK